jgi:hypothetical protein
VSERTKRRRVVAKPALPDEVLEAFKQALKLRAHREDEIADGKQCKGIGQCETCDEYERLVAVVDAALDVKPWQLSPVDVFDASPPPMWNDKWKEGWDRAREAHLALAKAAKIKPVPKGLIADGCRGQANVRWIERFGKIPDGPTVGEPFRLLEFQTSSARSTGSPNIGRQ